MNHDVKDNFIKRTMILDEIRMFYKEKGYLEVDVPALQTQYGGANAKPFITHINAWNMEMYLSVSPELYLKRLLVGGFEKVFTICKNFRNEGVDKTHNPEFTMMESYEAYIDYNTMMDMTEELFLRVANKVNGHTKARYNDQDIDVKGPWKRIPMITAIKDLAEIDVEKMSDDELKAFIEEKNISLDGSFERGWAILGIFEEFVEEKLIQPTFIIDYPKITSPLCKVHRNNPDLIERFEFFIAGKEFGNAYSELNDPIIQREVLEAQASEMRAGFEEAHPMDEDFVEAIETGMPPAGGLGIGVDRMVMLFTNSESLRDVIFFPTMKPQQIEEDKTEKSKDTMIAVALINKGLNLESWKEMNTIAHLNAAFAARIGKKLFLQDTIETKDHEKIKLNIQHAIMIKEAKNSKDIVDIIKEAKENDLDISEFTDEMIKTTDDKKVIEITKNKNLKEIDYLGVLIFGKKKTVDKITKKFELYN
jgi:lysyl-tRNA synthetase class 2